MIKAIKRQFRVLWSDYLCMMGVTLGAFVFGNILLTFVLRMDGEASGYFALGTVIAIIMAVLFGGIMGLVQIQQYFNIQVTMGSTRKAFFASYYLVTFLLNCAVGGILILLCAAENALNTVIYAGWKLEFDLMPGLIRGVVPAAALVTVISGFCGVMIMKFGRKASIILWCLWMFACLGGPQFMEAADEAPASLAGKVSGAVLESLGQVPMTVWTGIGVLIAAAGLAGTWMVLRRQQVMN